MSNCVYPDYTCCFHICCWLQMLIIHCLHFHELFLHVHTFGTLTCYCVYVTCRWVVVYTNNVCMYTVYLLPETECRSILEMSWLKMSTSFTIILKSLHVATRYVHACWLKLKGTHTWCYINHAFCMHVWLSNLVRLNNMYTTTYLSFHQVGQPHHLEA